MFNGVRRFLQFNKSFIEATNLRTFLTVSSLGISYIEYENKKNDRKNYRNLEEKIKDIKKSVEEPSSLFPGFFFLKSILDFSELVEKIKEEQCKFELLNENENINMIFCLLKNFVFTSSFLILPTITIPSFLIYYSYENKKLKDDIGKLTQEMEDALIKKE